MPAARVRFWRAGVVRKGDQAAPLLLPPTPISHATDAARHIYKQAGFEIVRSEPHHSFGKDLTAETWELDLRAETNAAPRTAS